MTASDHLSGQQFYHSTDSELQPGDRLKPGHRRESGGYHKSDDYSELGHHNFTWMTTKKPGPGKTFYGKNHYEVEPEGLHHPYSYDKAVGWNTDKPSYADSGRTWVSLAGAKVIRKVPDDEPRIGDTK